MKLLKRFFWTWVYLLLGLLLLTGISFVIYKITDNSGAAAIRKPKEPNLVSWKRIHHDSTEDYYLLNVKLNKKILHCIEADNYSGDSVGVGLSCNWKTFDAATK